MVVQDVMVYVYLLLSGSYLVLAGLLVMIHVYAFKIPWIVQIGSLLFFEFVSSAILTVSTGHNPIADFDVLRPWIVAARFCMTVCISWLSGSVALFVLRMGQSNRSDFRDYGIDHG
mgnify:CR=1 FL=1